MVYRRKVVLFANTEWYLYNFRLSLARALRDAGYEVLLVSPAGPYGARLLEHGFRWIAAPMHRRSLNPFREFWLLLWLVRLFHRERVDLVHGFTIKPAIYAALAARFRPGMGRVSAVAGLGYVFSSEDTLARALRPFVRWLMRKAFSGPNARLILQNEDDRRLFLDAGLSEPTLIHLIPGSGVDCDRFVPPEPGDASPSGQGPLRVLLAARLLRDKGVVEFVEAARALRARDLDIECLIAGLPDEGNPAAISALSLEQWHAEGCIRWLGHVEDMPTLYQGSDIVTLPSYREGLPKGLIEAGACGCALVTTDVPGCRAVVTDEVDGLLVPPRNPVALTEAIARLCDNTPLRKSLGLAARKKAHHEFDEKIVISRTLSVYSELFKRVKIEP